MSTTEVDGGATTTIARLRVLAGMLPGDTTAVIAGCIDELIWEAESQDDTDARWARCKSEFGAVAVDYTWREIVIEVPEADLLRYFDTPTIQGRVDASESAVEA